MTRSDWGSWSSQSSSEDQEAQARYARVAAERAAAERAAAERAAAEKAAAAAKKAEAEKAAAERHKLFHAVPISNPTAYAGKVVVVAGPPCSGKGTQCKRLAERLGAQSIALDPGG